MDHSQSKISEYLGKTCPYCKTEFKEGEEIVVCSACEMPHHKDCWIENQGCTTFGCQGTIRGVDGQAYGQMMAEGARQSAAPHFTPSGSGGGGYAPRYGASYGQSAASYGGQPPVNPYRAGYAAGGGASANPYRTGYAAGGGASANPYRTASAAPGPYCSRCGTRNVADAKFCFECGAELFMAPAPKNAPPPKPGIDAARPYDAIPKQSAANAARPYDAIPKQGADPTQPAHPYRAASQSASAQPAPPYGTAPQNAAANPYRPAPPPGYPPPSYAPPSYTPPGAAYPGAYRQASYPPPGAAAPLTPEEFAQEQRLFLQENEAYYQKKFAMIKSGQLAWNWSACLLGPFWLLYRRLYAWGYLTLLLQCVFFGIMGYAWPVIPLLSGILFGLFGTRIYFARVEQEMNRVRRLSAVNRRIEYADKGGVRIGQALSMAAVSALFLAGILSAIYY